MILSEAGGKKEFHETKAVIGSVLRRHLVPQNPDFPSTDAENFIGTYRAALDDLWHKSEATKALENLSRSLGALSASYETVPNLVMDDLAARANGIYWQRLEKYQEKSQDEIQSSPPPTPDETHAVEALKVLTSKSAALRIVIDATRAGLPEGIQTRNRPTKAWAVIHGAAAVCRSGSRIYVPKAIGESGPMFRLLKDLFDLFVIEQSVAGAFGGWREHMDGKYENFDLMPI